ncbi:MAG TPA: hypothetical protein VFZ91_15240 [Allosphingosinicella sp.]
MGPGAFLIAIMGCGEGDAPCREVRTLETRYQSQAACAAATDAAVTANVAIDYPVVVAQCVAAGAGGERLRPGDVLLPERASAPALQRPMNARRS